MRPAFLPAVSLVALAPSVHAAEPFTWSATESEGRLEARFGGKPLLTWQAKALEDPVGGTKFAGSAFLHPLRTPAGFEWTTAQPADHKHHFGLWWPWKFIEVDGNRYNTWEIQEGQGAHIARSFKTLPASNGGLAFAFQNLTEIRKNGKDGKTVIDENARVETRVEGDAQIIDIELHQKASGSPVKIVEYRYSGFSWRGTPAWNRDNSTMTTSEGLGRDNANGKAARWVMVSGTTPQGNATILLMSAAAQIAGTPEQLRVWDSNAEKGTPFINFNPVMEKPLLLNEANPAVSHRKYRIIAADRIIDPPAAEAEWRMWMKK